VEYKLHDYRYPKFDRFYDIVREAMANLGHNESDNPNINIYNHCHKSELSTTNNIILKPTGPTSKHFALDSIGYANSSTLAFIEPFELRKEYTNNSSDKIKYLIECKANKWDDSILLKWRQAKNIASDHILIIGQVPTDETVNGFGFGDHFLKLSMIVEKLKDKNIIVKLHPSMKIDHKQQAVIDKWIKNNIDVRTQFESIHDFLPKTKVAILENSTAGIECLMHQVPIISYGWPEYHWATKKLQSLTQLEDLVNDLSWHKLAYANRFIEWYINKYLCHDVKSTQRRLLEIIQWK